ncbi:MAG TPA: CoA-transferase [Elusimicrobiota bacterium]|jgi:glutaconate CoA-transferase subunit B|nr:CoA-transferase [Elusimicrobiota bacterium]
MTAAVETATEYTLNELMCVLAAREIKDGDVVFVGIGLPNLACNLARATHAPNMTLIYESGAVGAVPDRVPPSIGDPALVTGSLMVTSMSDIFQSFLQNGKIQVGFLGGAQVDKRGNINTTVVGPYASPKVRLPGSGGACEIAIHAQRVLIVTKLDKRAFPEKVDFITSSGKRVKKVITNMGILEPDETGELMLTSSYPNVTFEQVQENVGWKLKRKNILLPVALPMKHEIDLLRNKLDPKRRHIK